MLKFKRKNKLYTVFVALCLLCLSYSAYGLIIWKLDSYNIDKQVDVLNKSSDIKETADSGDTEYFNPPKDGLDPYWDFIKIPLIDVNFAELKKINSDTRGWIQVSGTNINYPFVQYHDNEYYLTRSFDKRRNYAGWAFLDYRNDIDNLAENSIIYAHGRVGGKMFGTLKNILSSNWYSNNNFHVIKLSTERENTLWQVFSVYKIKTTNDYIQTSFSSVAQYKTFLDMVEARSAYNFDTNLDERDKILTLSTCFTESERTVMHAKLIKIDPR